MLGDFVPKFLDPYDRPARLYPGLLCVAPVAVLLVCLYGKNNIWGSSVLSILGFSGVAYALGRVARDAGKQLQDSFYVKWGGAPTTQLLRHRDTRFDIHTKERFHGILSRGIKKPFPSIQDETADPIAADELYRAAIEWLINQTRDTKKFPLVFKENVAYGFQRNCLGLRLYGVAVATICLAWALLHAQVLTIAPPFLLPERIPDLEPAVKVTLGISSVMIFTWLFLLTEAALKRTAFSYAERLLQSCDHLQRPTRAAKSDA